MGRGVKVSLNTIKQFADINLSLDELVIKINSQLGAIEEIIDLGDKYKDAIIVEIIQCDKHPAADRLNVCMVDDGGMVQDVDRDENGYVQVVCGAPNVHTGMFAVWLPPRSVVPVTYNDKEPFILGARELRGIMSQGMLAAADELGIGSDHEGILEIYPDEWKPNDIITRAGVRFAEAYGLNDTIIDIENKMFTHRPDLFGQLGVAREIAGIQREKFVSPEWYSKAPKFKGASGLKLDIFNDAGDKVPRFMAVAIEGVEVKPSPLWLQCALVSMGSKPINNIVDVTNYVMLLTAQPTHAYDYDKLHGQVLGARMAKNGETINLLNGKTYELTESDVVIADAEGAVGLGGIMGGSSSEVSADTKNIVIEVANFDMYAVRKSSMRHGIFTDAVTRFNKGQNPLQNDRIMSLVLHSVLDVTPGKQASQVFDTGTATEQSTPKVTSSYINDRLGLELNDSEIAVLLENVELGVTVGNKKDPGLKVLPPFWRTDIKLPEDIVEEVGRLYGFDHLPRILPKRSAKPASLNSSRQLKRSIRDALSRVGANEVLTYSFVHEKVIQKAGQDITHAYKITNALSPDLQYYRLSLTPSLLDKVHMNYKAGYDSFALFELGKTHIKDRMDPHEPTVPNEDDQLAFVVVAKKPQDGAAYYQALRYMKRIVDARRYSLVPLSESASLNSSIDTWSKQLTTPYEPTRSAVIVVDNIVRGVVGEYRDEVKRAFKLPHYAAGFEIHFDSLATSASSYKPLSKFPSVTQDISLKVDASISYSALEKVVQAELASHSNINIVLRPITVYQATDDDTTKTVTFSIEVTSHFKTLRDKDVTEILETVAAVANSKLGAEQA